MIFFGSLFMFALYFSFALLVGVFCRNRNIGFWGGFLISLFLSPLIGSIIGLVSGRKQQIILQAQQPSVIIQQHIANNPTTAPAPVQQPKVAPIEQQPVEVVEQQPIEKQSDIEAAVIELLKEVPQLKPTTETKALSENTDSVSSESL